MAKLANLQLPTQAVAKFQTAFDETLSVVGNLAKLDTDKSAPTHQVTGQVNQWREDKVEPSLTPKQAMSGCKKTHRGYFVVDRILDND